MGQKVGVCVSDGQEPKEVSRSRVNTPQFLMMEIHGIGGETELQTKINLSRVMSINTMITEEPGEPSFVAVVQGVGGIGGYYSPLTPDEAESFANALLTAAKDLREKTGDRKVIN